MSLLQLRGIAHSFGTVGVLKGIDLTLNDGEVLGLIGENGAGKSTLMNIVGGLFRPTRGELFLNDHPYRPASPQDALGAGITFIHQELNLFPNLTVAENLRLSTPPVRRVLGLPLVDRRRLRDTATRSLETVGLAVDPDTPLDRLSPAQRQLVEIAKALSSRPRLVIFDEPTTALSRHEAEHLFRLIDRLRGEGIAMIYISHNLEDVVRLADRIAVLRDGNLVRTITREEGYRIPELVNAMVGRQLDQFFPRRKGQAGREVLLRVEDLAAGTRVRGVNLNVKRGEVVGCYGLVGAGRSETARLIYGLDAFSSGRLYWRGEPVARPLPRKWIERGLGFLTEDRREEGLLMEQGITGNVALGSYARHAAGPFGRLRGEELRERASRYAAATHVSYDDLHRQAVATLSGGNQQKVVLAKWLMTEPTLLMLDEPTKGIDVGAKHEIYTLIHELADGGTGILLISSEIEELLGMCDRILVMSGGRVTAEFPRSGFDREAILSAALHRQTPEA